MLNHEVIEFKVDGLKTDLEVLDFLSNLLLEKGIVKETFKEAIKVREQNFSTGLLVNDIGFAIPHTDVEHVNESQIAILTLNEPVSFKQMGDDSVTVPVRVVFMLALKEAKAHLNMLQKLIELMQDEKVIHQLVDFSQTEDNKKALVSLLKDYDVI